MSTAVVSTSAAPGRPFLFDAEPDGGVPCHPERSGTCAKRMSRGVEGSLLLSTDSRLVPVTPASRLAIRPAPEMASTGIPALDNYTGGLPRGCLTELCGPASSGRTSVMLSSLAAATHRGEYCAVIDASDSLDPQALDASSVDLDHLLWIRCNDNSPQRHRDSERKERGKGCPISAAPFAAEVGIFAQTPFNFSRRKHDVTRASEHRLEQALRATDLLLESGGFGLIILDLADLPPQTARRIPLTTWFRFRRSVEHKSTILLAVEQHPIAGSCSSLVLQLRVPSTQYPVPSTNPSHTQLMTELQVNAEQIRSRLDRKPSRSIAFETKTAWAG